MNKCLLFAENYTFFVAHKCILNFAKLLYLLASIMKTPFIGEPLNCHGRRVSEGHAHRDLLILDREQCQLEVASRTN